MQWTMWVKKNTKMQTQTKASPCLVSSNTYRLHVVGFNLAAAQFSRPSFIMTLGSICVTEQARLREHLDSFEEQMRQTDGPLTKCKHRILFSHKSMNYINIFLAHLLQLRRRRYKISGNSRASLNQRWHARTSCHLPVCNLSSLHIQEFFCQCLFYYLHVFLSYTCILFTCITVISF